MGLGDDVGGLALGLGEHRGADLLGLLLGLGDDGVGLVVRLEDLGLVALGLLGRLDLGALRGVEVVLDLLLALLHHLQDRGPHELGHDGEDDEEGDERGDELRHLGDQDVRTHRGLLCERHGRRGQDDATGDTRARNQPHGSVFHTCLQSETYGSAT